MRGEEVARELLVGVGRSHSLEVEERRCRFEDEIGCMVADSECIAAGFAIEVGRTAGGFGRMAVEYYCMNC